LDNKCGESGKREIVELRLAFCVRIISDTRIESSQINLGQQLADIQSKESKGEKIISA
jgi:hypothetical protein